MTQYCDAHQKKQNVIDLRQTPKQDPARVLGGKRRGGRMSAFAVLLIPLFTACRVRGAFREGKLVVIPKREACVIILKSHTL